MAFERRSLDELLVWTGLLLLAMVTLPLAIYFTWHMSNAAHYSLAERAGTLGRNVAVESVHPMLVNDRLALHDRLMKALESEAEAFYVVIADPQGQPVAHTFARGYPARLRSIWDQANRGVARFRSSEGPMMDVAVPIMDGRLGSVHVGMSRRAAAQTTRRTLAVMSVALALALATLLGGSRFVAAKVCRPLHRLEAEVALLPERSDGLRAQEIGGTREVRSLAAKFSDMIERQRGLEREREQTIERMVHTERLAALGTLTAGLAHEINNPLDGMLECVRFLSADPHRSERSKKFYPMMEEGLNRISRVMSGMLTFARTGREVRLAPYPMRDLLSSALVLVEPKLQQMNVKLAWKKPGGCVCLCDRDAASQAILNIVLNAAEAAAESEVPTVRLDAFCAPEDVYLMIEDSGLGVPDDLRERIFDPFVTSKPRDRGTGLGLAVSRQLIRAVGGDIILCEERSELGGAKFAVRLRRVMGTEDTCDA